MLCLKPFVRCSEIRNEFIENQSFLDESGDKLLPDSVRAVRPCQIVRLALRTSMIRRNPPALFLQYKVPHQIRYTLAFLQYSIYEKTGQVGGWLLGANALYEFTIEDTA